MENICVFFKSMFSLKVVEFLFAFRKENKKIHFLFAFRKETEKCITVYTCRLSFAYCCKTLIKDESASVFRTLLISHSSARITCSVERGASVSLLCAWRIQLRSRNKHLC